MIGIKRLLSLLICSVLAGQFLAGTGEKAETQAAGKQFQRLFKKHERLKLHRERLRELIGRRANLRIDTPTQKLEFQLLPNDVRAKSYRAEESIAGGTRQLLNPSSINTYRGKLAGVADSEVRFTVDENRFEGLIIKGNQKFFLEPVQKFEPSGDSSDFVLYEESDVVQEEFGTCATPLSEQIEDAETIVDPGFRASAAYEQIELATEADYEYVNRAGGSQNANKDILGIVNQIDGIYKQQLGLTIKVVYQHTWAEEDDPYTTTGASNILMEFSDYWGENRKSIKRDLSHMWTGRAMGGAVAGIASLGVVCRFPARSYGVSKQYSSSFAKAAVTAHEIAHNLGARHVQDSGCETSLMTPGFSSNTKAVFCDVTRGQIASYLNSNSACLASVDIDGPTPPAPVPTTPEVLTGSINLVEGWNLISTPLDSRNYRIETALSTILSKLTVVYAYRDEKYQTYAPGLEASDLKELRPGLGYWVYMAAPARLIVGGTLASSSVPVSQGWNLVGLNSINKVQVSVATRSLGNRILAIYGYDAEAIKYDVYEPSMYLDPGKGYWVYTEANGVWGR
jgi:hypothetical protein